ncbi:MAG: nucleotidyltransferase domain-containing protein [Desulfobacterales bacterium]|nr:nucleotidyltransferase domain-containing protein [Desulfobacterales bacterium]
MEKTLSKNEKKILNNFKTLLSKNVPLHRLILFGSRARGDAAKDSDMDVAIIIDDNSVKPYQDIIDDNSWESGFEYGIVISPVTFTYDKWIQKLEPIIKNIKREGIEI